MQSFAADLRAVLIPARKWHYVFHFLVMLVAASYWLGSLVKLPDASWAEIAIYRPRGDNEVYPAISALSRLNFGDPTDALHYGDGTSGAQAVILFPYALSYALFGIPGYMVADIFLTWLYFLGVVLLLRQCNFGNFSSLLLGSALATRSLQILSSKIGHSFEQLLSISNVVGTWEWGFPNLLDLHIFPPRIPRPMVTETLVMLLLYILLRQWKERNMPSFRRGLALGALFALLLQGDPFTLSALGLVSLWVFGWTLGANRWRIPWRFLGGSILGALTFGCYFFWQRLMEHPDASIRFGVAEYPRDHFYFLPGYAPLLRVGVVCVLAGMVTWTARLGKRSVEWSQGQSGSKKNSRTDTTSGKMPTAENGKTASLESMACFFVAVVVAGWLAQPVQLLLLGKGCQIYHYLIFTLPTLYAYAVVILLFNFFKLATAPELPDLVRRFGDQPGWAGTALLSVFLVFEAMVGMESKLAAVSSLTTARQEINVPWGNTGNLYRPCFRALEKQFRKNPTLTRTRSFATICYEVNFLLAAFHDKRAYLPDNGYSTLSDEQLEDRLCETLKILQLQPEDFAEFIQVNFMLNYWLGCAKYWLTTDYQYSTRDDYTDDVWPEVRKQAKESPWILCLPQSELRRLSKKYAEIFAREPNHETYPDTLVVGLEKTLGLVPKPEWYREVYTNDLFSVYVKKTTMTTETASETSASINQSQQTE